MSTIETDTDRKVFAKLIKMTILITSYTSMFKDFFKKRAFRKSIEEQRNHCVELEVVTPPSKILEAYLIPLETLLRPYDTNHTEIEKLKNLLTKEFNNEMGALSENNVKPEISEIKLVLKEDGENVLKQVDVIQSSEASKIVENLIFNHQEINGIFNRLSLKGIIEMWGNDDLNSAGKSATKALLDFFGPYLLKDISGRYRVNEESLDYVIELLSINGNQISLKNNKNEPQIITSDEVLELLETKKMQPSNTTSSARHKM